MSLLLYSRVYFEDDGGAFFLSVHHSWPAQSAVAEVTLSADGGSIGIVYYLTGNSYAMELVSGPFIPAVGAGAYYDPKLAGVVYSAFGSVSAVLNIFQFAQKSTKAYGGGDNQEGGSGGQAEGSVGG